MCVYFRKEKKSSSLLESVIYGKVEMVPSFIKDFTDTVTVHLMLGPR